MRKNLALLLLLAVFAVFVTPSVFAADAKAQKSDKKMENMDKMKEDKAHTWNNWDAIVTHAQKHVEYPTTKEKLMEACNKFADVSQADKDMFARLLPEGDYKNAGQVISALKRTKK